MGLNGVSVNNASEEHVNYDSLNDRIVDADFDTNTKSLSFRDENGTLKFSVEIPQDTVNVDATLSNQGEAADAKKVGDELDRIEGMIPSLDTTLSDTGSAADSGATGSAITNAMNHVAEGFNDAIEDWVENNPEAFTVSDNAVTYAKLNDEVRINNWKSGSGERLARFGYWFVDGINGDDTNDGKTANTAFATLGRALDEARKGDVEVRISFAGGQTYSVTATNFTALCLHFIVHGTGNATINMVNSGTSIAFYHCHINFQGTSARQFIWNGDGVHFDSGAVQCAYTTINQSLISYGASVRSQNSTWNNQVTLYNCGAMFENCEMSAVSADSSKVYFNDCIYHTNVTVDSTDRIIQLTNCVTSAVGSSNVIDLSGSENVFTFFKLFGGELFWRGGFTSVIGSGATPSVGISANTGAVYVRREYFSWLSTNFTTGIDLQYNARCETYLDEIWSGTVGFGSITANKPLYEGHTYQIVYKANSGANIVETFTMESGTCRFFTRCIYGSSSINIKVIELEFTSGSANINIASNRQFFIPTSGNASVTSYDAESSITNNSYLVAIKEVC